MAGGIRAQIAQPAAAVKRPTWSICTYACSGHVIAGKVRSFVIMPFHDVVPGSFAFASTASGSTPWKKTVPLVGCIQLPGCPCGLDQVGPAPGRQLQRALAEIVGIMHAERCRRHRMAREAEALLRTIR